MISLSGRLAISPPAKLMSPYQLNSAEHLKTSSCTRSSRSISHWGHQPLFRYQHSCQLRRISGTCRDSCSLVRSFLKETWIIGDPFQGDLAILPLPTTLLLMTWRADARAHSAIWPVLTLAIFQRKASSRRQGPTGVHSLAWNIYY